MRMKELSLYGIRDLALESGRAVFSVQQLANITGKPRAVATVYSSRLVKKGMAKKLSKGTISFASDDFVIATQLIEPSYVSLNSALLLHGVIQQVSKNTECVTTRNSLRFRKLGITYHKIPASLFFGYKKQARENSHALVADAEKAVLDGLYLGNYSKKDLQEFKSQVDFEKLREFAEKFKGNGSKKIKELIKNA
jgi:predicted transcriptional regulator of viral defense system